VAGGERTVAGAQRGAQHAYAAPPAPPRLHGARARQLRQRSALRTCAHAPRTHSRQRGAARASRAGTRATLQAERGTHFDGRESCDEPCARAAPSAHARGSRRRHARARAARSTHKPQPTRPAARASAGSCDTCAGRCVPSSALTTLTTTTDAAADVGVAPHVDNRTRRWCALHARCARTCVSHTTARVARRNGALLQLAPCPLSIQRMPRAQLALCSQRTPTQRRHTGAQHAHPARPLRHERARRVCTHGAPHHHHRRWDPVGASRVRAPPRVPPPAVVLFLPTAPRVAHSVTSSPAAR
jgi:hypothetical protein